MNYTYRKLRALIWTGAAIASAAAYFTADTVESGLARDRLEAEFEPGLGNIRSEVLVAANSTLYYIANRIASSGVTVSNATSKLAVELAGTYGLDEVNFADMEGVIRASTHPEQIGYFMGTDPDKTKAAGFLSLLSDMQWYDQPPRTSVQADGVYRKFCGVRLGDGLLQVGINYKRISAEMRQHFADVCCDWAVAGDGWYILACVHGRDALQRSGEDVHVDDRRAPRVLQGVPDSGVRTHRMHVPSGIHHGAGAESLGRHDDVHPSVRHLHRRRLRPQGGHPARAR